MIMKNPSFMQRYISEMELKSIKEFEAVQDGSAQKLIDLIKEQHAELGH